MYGMPSEGREVSRTPRIWENFREEAGKEEASKERQNSKTGTRGQAGQLGGITPTGQDMGSPVSTGVTRVVGR